MALDVARAAAALTVIVARGRELGGVHLGIGRGFWPKYAQSVSRLALFDGLPAAVDNL